ncbi:MAG: ribonuclease P protein component [Elusimicrobia bacterium]|nr:ribonuclease P protein component [Elusimicrobiota bacterium]
MNEFSFQKSLRIKKRKLFDFMFKNGKKTATKNLVMWHIVSDKYEQQSFSKNSLNYRNIKLGLVVSRKLGNAVKRNKTKRLLREAFRLSKSALKDGAGIIIYPLSGCNLETMEQTVQELKKLWLKAGIYNEEAKK